MFDDFHHGTPMKQIPKYSALYTQRSHVYAYQLKCSPYILSTFIIYMFPFVPTEYYAVAIVLLPLWQPITLDDYH